MARYLLPTWRNPEEHRRVICERVNQLLDGQSNNAGAVTLADSQATTTVTDARAGTDSVIVFMPLTANAAAEVGAGGMYISTRNNGSFVITHANNAQTDRDFEYAILASGRST